MGIFLSLTCRAGSVGSTGNGLAVVTVVTVATVVTNGRNGLATLCLCLATIFNRYSLDNNCNIVS